MNSGDGIPNGKSCYMTRKDETEIKKIESLLLPSAPLMNQPREWWQTLAYLLLLHCPSCCLSSHGMCPS